MNVRPETVVRNNLHEISDRLQSGGYDVAVKSLTVTKYPGGKPILQWRWNRAARYWYGNNRKPGEI